ncbi:nicotinate phosphoribosyltransferase [Legionella lansingensis]|uniref:Nicotinate phosphoribosyltransferase n=1 Tax=Legionella lansingensis TaxID=45067 RepID=A0A0W0VTU8_9GAMM|nr:nicotinate phosphoribosyltransferase [Legionella lansingensis]KTD23489.1 nicotinate phosphoribosyltransferase [Legionella lansingensis]SNV50756.1 nicotinate phosphoribosyltransferase [Legionella lansingensis]
MFNYTGLYTDKYQLTMAQVYFLKGQKDHIAIFDYFFRKLPFAGGYAVFAGLHDLLDILENIHFDKTDIRFLQQQGFDSQFLNYLKDFRFKGNVYSCQEGEVVFPYCPVITIEANIIEAQIIETLLLNIVNFQTLIATKASRIRQAAGQRVLIDFGLRRAQAVGGYYASRAAVIGGFDATSNLSSGRDYHIPTSGTMAHSFVQSYNDELAAFRDFAELWPDSCVLLVDTYHTLDSGLPNAITVAKEMEQRGHRLQGIRLDSGDLAYLAKVARQRLDEAGMQYIKIIASNQLDEHVIKSLLDQKAPIDMFGVGTNLVIGHPDGALDGVYKLALANEKPCIKLSESLSKINLPDRKQVYRILADDGTFWGADVIALKSEKEINLMHHSFESSKSLSLSGCKKEAMLQKVMEKGKGLSVNSNVSELRQYSQERLSHLPNEYKRFNNPHIYKVGLSTALKDKRDQLIQYYTKKL